jgi:hypothetical protein
LVHGAVNTLFRTIMACITIVVFGLALLAWRLSDGPVVIDFLAPYVSGALSAAGDGVSFQAQGAVLSWKGFQSSPDVAVQNITVIDQGGGVIASFPEMLVRLSVESILEGEFAPKEVILESPLVRLTRSLEGEMLFGLDALSGSSSSVGGLFSVQNEEPLSGNEEAANQLLNVVIRALTDPGGAGNRAGYLDKVLIQKSRVVFSDMASGSEWLVPAGDISLERQSGDVLIIADLPFLNDGRTSKIGAKGTYDVSEKGLSLTLNFQDVRPSSFSNLASRLTILDGVELDLDGEAAISLEFNGPKLSITSARVDIREGEGVLKLAAPVGRTYPVQSVSMLANAGRNLDSINVEFLDVKSSERGPSLKVKVIGENMLSAPELDLSIEIDEVTLSELKSYWPQEMKPNTRRWITKNLNGGEIKDAQINIVLTGADVTKLKASSLNGSGDLSGISVTYLRQMPPVDGVNGRLILSDSEVVIDVTSGDVSHINEEGARLSIQEARVRLHGLDNKTASADIDIRINSEVKDVVALLDKPPLGYASKLGISESRISGRADVLLDINFPLVQGVSLKEVEVSAMASLQDTRVAAAAFGLDLESGQFSLDIDNDGMDVRGTAEIGGIQTGLAWRENFSPGEFKRQYALDAVLENSQRPLVGLAQAIFAPPYVDGPIRLEAIYTVNEAENNTLIVEANVEQAVLRVPALNWTKAATVPGLISAEVLFDGGMLGKIRHFEVSSPDAGLQFVGDAEFSNGTELRSVSLHPGQIGSSKFGLTALRQVDGVFDIEMQGVALDARAFWTSLRKSNSARSFDSDEDAGARLPYKFRGKIDQVLLSDAGIMRGVDATIEQGDQGLSELSVTGDVVEGERFNLSMVPQGDTRVFAASSRNGGAVLAALGFADSFRGGDLNVTGVLSESGDVSGDLIIDTFEMVGAPLLARLLSVAALTGIVDELQGNGIFFSTLNLPFEASDGAFKITDGAIYGPSIGLTANGIYDTNKNTIDGEGTIIPAYALNSVLGGIPILGPLLTGGEAGGGVFAATYAMRGNPDGATITVNPFATLTPGFLRWIFRVFDPPPAKEVTPEQAPQN